MVPPLGGLPASAAVEKSSPNTAVPNTVRIVRCPHQGAAATREPCFGDTRGGVYYIGA
jgi:hypothetical protein